MNNDSQRLAEAYRNLVEQVHCGFGLAEADECEIERPSELEVQALWHSGLLGSEGDTLRHGKVHILDFGEWNRSVGPDFLRAEIEIDGARMRGDIEIDPTAQDWERHGHGANPDFNQVILHVVLAPPPAGWYTRNEQHRDIPILPIPQQTLRAATGAGKPLPRDCAGFCRTPLSALPISGIELLLKAAAAYRAQNKRRIFRRKAEIVGTDQAWYEALAETLGYKINKVPMQLLARRAPLHAIRNQTESILFGTAGFLVPMLPAQADGDARDYHRRVWDGWWARREEFALSEGRALPWRYAPLRPANHPHRRVAALALAAAHWSSIKNRLTAEHAKELSRLLTSLSHPYWNERCSLPSSKLSAKAALIGEERVKDFLVNHVYVQDEAPFAWQTYLSMKNRNIPQKVLTTAQHLFGDREDALSLLPMMYAQQALLQIDTDFCSSNSCRDCLFPEQLADWTLS